MAHNVQYEERAEARAEERGSEKRVTPGVADCAPQELDGRISGVHEQIDRAQEFLIRLEANLRPVLREDPTVEEVRDDLTPLASPLANQLRYLAQRVEDVADTASRLLDRVDL